MSVNLSLRGKTVDVFGSINKLAQHIGWSYAKSYRIITGAQQPTVDDMRTLIQALGMNNADEIVSAFHLK